MSSTTIVRQDAILPMTDDYMQHIVQGKKNYEFRRYRIAASVTRVWFHLIAPQSHIGYICELDNAVTRTATDEKLEEDGLGNKEFNEGHNGCDYAYRICSVYELRKPITLAIMKSKYGMKIAPRGLVYTPLQLVLDTPWQDQNPILQRLWGGNLVQFSVDTSGVKVLAWGNSLSENHAIRKLAHWDSDWPSTRILSISFRVDCFSLKGTSGEFNTT